MSVQLGRRDSQGFFARKRALEKEKDLVVCPEILKNSARCPVSSVFLDRVCFPVMFGRAAKKPKKS
jgi:hypothetical protein